MTPTVSAESVHRGVVTEVTVPGADAPVVFTAELAPGPPRPDQRRPEKTIRLLWHGRRRVPRIMPGQWLTVTGAVTVSEGVPTIFNPAYELIEAPSSR